MSNYIASTYGDRIADAFEPIEPPGLPCRGWSHAAIGEKSQSRIRRRMNRRSFHPVLYSCALAACVLAGSAFEAAAQHREPSRLMATGLFGTGVVDSELGLTGGVGLAVRAPRYVLRALFDVHVVQDDSGYAWELGSSGPECRDDQTGAVVHESLCRIDRVLTGVSTDASLIVPAFGGGIHIGSGYRFGSGSTLYGLAGYGFNKRRVVLSTSFSA